MERYLWVLSSLPFFFVATAQAQLELQIDQERNLRIVNISQEPVQLDGYHIQTLGHPLDLDAWSSIADMVSANAQNVIDLYGSGAVGFNEGNPTGGFFGELSIFPLILQPEQAIELGIPFTESLADLLDNPPVFRYGTLLGFNNGLFDFDIREGCLGGGECSQVPDTWPSPGQTVGLSDFSLLKNSFGETLSFDSGMPIVFSFGDLNRDGYVGLEDLHLSKRDPNLPLDDFSFVKADFGQTPWAHFEQNDFNVDGRVGLEDFAMLKNLFGSSASLQASVPEPSTLFLALMGAIAFGLFARGRK